MSKSILVMDDVSVEFAARRGRGPVRVLDGVHLEIERGRTLGLLGESGSGKTTIGRAILGLQPISGGTIALAGERVDLLDRRRRRALSSRVQAVFQDPRSSLNPRMTVTEVITEPLRAQGMSARHAAALVPDLLDAVSLPRSAALRMPTAFSGGQRQRIAIARAIAVDPDVIVCDEPVSALDMMTRRRVLDLLIQVQEKTGVGLLFISHDVAAVQHVSHRVAVLADGRIVEAGDAERVLTSPEHPLTQRLVLSVPLPDPREQARRRDRRLALETS